MLKEGLCTVTIISRLLSLDKEEHAIFSLSSSLKGSLQAPETRTIDDGYF